MIRMIRQAASLALRRFYISREHFQNMLAYRRSPFGAAKFEQRPPSHANAIEIFSGRWASDLAELDPTWRGGAAKLTKDPRPDFAAQYLGVSGFLTGMTVLELGPLEGAHTYRLEQLGAARILAIESNVEAYLKCLILKEALGMKRAEFKLGDFVLYLQDSAERFDLVFCCGVLYHMEDPLKLIRDIARVSDKCLVWTHYLDESRGDVRVATPVSLDGIDSTYYRAPYRDRAQPGFWGGNKPSASWMKREDIFAAFRHFGLDDIKIIAEDSDAPHGPTTCFAARRTGKA
jgi:SAM-dependent methyltransferase